MPAFKDPGFQERTAAAARARSEALAKLKAKPPIDEAAAAEATARRLAREAAEAEKREAVRRAREEAAEAKRQAALERAAQEEAEAQARAAKPVLTEAERKAARDARYAARKNRKAGR